MKKYFFANWKMYLNVEESCRLASEIRALPADRDDCVVGVFPNELAFRDVFTILADSPIDLGAQNVAWVSKGAYTGATSAHLYKDAGARYALVGHSERRHIFGEKDRDATKKMHACFDAGIVPVLCIGETEEDKTLGKRQYRLKKQLFSALDGIDLAEQEFLVAYEPVWAIGSGVPCQPVDVDDVHGWIRLELKQYTDRPIPLLYGGSVETNNIVSYITRPDVDGVLVGSASTTVDSFSSLFAQFVQA